MSEQFLGSVFQNAAYAVEFSVCLLLVWRGRWRRLKGLGLYVAGLLLLDGVARPAVLDRFGPTSINYEYFYWLTDVGLALGAFLLICSFFRRACAEEETRWRFIRLMLVSVFVLVLGVSALKLTSNYTHLFTHFIIEFSQNLYFTCLVLNTLLYVMIQQLAIDDDELGLLVCGMGVQFAGEAACLALLRLTFNEHFARVMLSHLGPACTLGMLGIWAYAIVKTPQTSPARLQPGKDARLVEAIAD
jgi:heme A synthase